MTSSRRKRQLKGLAGLAAVAAVTTGAILAYEQVLTPGVPATVLSDEAGLLMTPGAAVTLYGADVGRVTSVTPDGNQARLGISIDPGQLSAIPANVQASIQAPTVFGPKYLSLSVPARTVARRLRPGQVIEPAAVPTEINTVFASLASVLHGIDPAKLSAMLGAVSTALQGRGGQLGGFLVQLNSYLRKFNPSLPALSADLAIAPRVLSTYAAAAPDLIRTLGNLRVTAGTLVARQAQFDAFLLDLAGFSGKATDFLNVNGNSLERTLALLAPTAGLLARYSPEIPCVLGAAPEILTLKRLSLVATAGPGINPYAYPRNLPEVRAASGPVCAGGPLTPAQAARWGLESFDDGAGNYSGSAGLSPGSPPLAVRLFGPGSAAARRAAAGKGK